MKTQCEKCGRRVTLDDHDVELHPSRFTGDMIPFAGSKAVYCPYCTGSYHLIPVDVALAKQPPDLQHLADTAAAIKLQVGLLELARRDGRLTVPTELEGIFATAVQRADDLARGLAAAFNEETDG